MGPMWARGVSAAGGLRQSLPNFSRGIVPKFPVECSPYECIAWERRFEVFIANQDLRHTISPDAPEIAVISCINNAYLFGQFGEDLVLEHRRVWGYISEATADAPFDSSLYKYHFILDALRMMREWSLPLHPAERHLLVAELERVQFMGGEDPNFFSARTAHLETTMRAIGIEKDASEIVQFILRQFPERPLNPYALVVGRSFRDARAVGVGVQRRDDHMASRGGGMPQQQQQQWSHGGGMPRQQQHLQQHWSRDGGMPRQQQQQQLHYWSRDGGMSRQQQPQQQWSRGGGIPHQHQSRSNAFPPVRQARQQQPSRIPTIGGDGEDASSPYLNLFLAVMAGLFRSGFSQKMWRCRCSPCWRNCSSRHRRPAVLFPRLHYLGGQSGRASRLLWRKRLRRQRARHRRQYLQQRRRPAVLFSPLHRWGGRPGRLLLQTKQRHRRQRRRPAVLFPPLRRWGRRPGRPLLQMKQRHRRRHRRPAVLFPRLHHLGVQSGRASRLLERRQRTLQRRRHRRPAILLPLIRRWRGRLTSSR